MARPMLSRGIYKLARRVAPVRRSSASRYNHSAISLYDLVLVVDEVWLTVLHVGRLSWHRNVQTDALGIDHVWSDIAELGSADETQVHLKLVLQ
jgi:hypothetical protein